MSPTALPSDVSPPTTTPALVGPLSGDRPGLCGLTGDQWRVLLIFVVLLLLILPVMIIVSWQQSKDCSVLWLQLQESVEMARMDWREKLLRHLLRLTDNDIRLINLEPGAIQRR
ncbi:hypothetical protein F5148DRAFT_1282380 [Russula earlei]|uniref:Uncharacterized protein n=1 Tax=Russula earlei TaxID=71964 RepID=A0ACC0UEC5_9AGAM|nr:hypothetical protein F5148DRAFT_1282380 [Russula earlei]